ncbi:MAG: DUF839 domain-containing protein [Hyphomicrobiales bacterium]
MNARTFLMATTALMIGAGSALAADISFSPVKFPATDAEKRAVQASATVTIDGKASPIGYNVLLRSGDMGFGALFDRNGQPVKRADGSPDISSDTDFSSLIKVGDKLYSISHFEALPGEMYLTELAQDENGKLSAIATRPVDFKADGGLWWPCAGSVTPWNTHLGSEEYPANARDIAEAKKIEDIDDEFKPIARYFGLDPATMTLDEFRAAYNPYRNGYINEVAIAADGAVTARKHYAAGRLSVELGYVMPDRKTVYITDDGTNVGLFRFVADKEGDLSAGTLHVAKWTQTSAGNGGTADISWVDLGHADSAAVAALINAGTTFADIFELAGIADDGSCPAGFLSSNADEKTECLKVRDGMAIAASRLETRRYASMLGGTTEFRKMEGITFDAAGSRLYLSISSVERGMEDNAKNGKPTDKYEKGSRNDIRLASNKCGTVYELGVDGNMAATSMRGLVVGKEATYAEGTPEAGTTCDIDGIANPDNLTFIAGTSTLIIGEDTGSGHQNDAVWAYDTASGALTRIETTPYGSETTSVYWYGDIGGHGYLMSVIQHPYGESDQDKLADPADARAYVGYIGPFPAVK